MGIEAVLMAVDVISWLLYLLAPSIRRRNLLLLPALAFAAHHGRGAACARLALLVLSSF